MIPPQNPTGQVTGNEAEAFEQFVQQTIRDEHARYMQQQAGNNPQQTPQAPTAATPWTVNVGGRQAVFNNQEELSAFLTNFQNQVSQVVNSNAVAAPPAAPTGEVTGRENDAYSVDQFVDQITKDPRKAIVDALKASGYDLDELVSAKQQLEEQKAVFAAAQFKEAFPDFPASDQAAQMLNALREKFGQPFTFEGLSAAYALGDRMGAFNGFRQMQPPMQPQQPQFQTAPQFQPGPAQMPFAPGQFAPGYLQNPNPGYPAPGQFAPQAPPRIGRSAMDSQTPDWAAQADDMSLDQLEQVLSKLGAQR